MTPFKGRYWHVIQDNMIECTLCPRNCKLRDGKRGFCFARQNIGGEMILTSYGKSSGFCIDPIEKKPLNHFLPGTSVFSLGTVGCNLGCKFCQNWDISKAIDLERLQDEASPETIANAALQLGCRSVAFTYNDPVIFLEYAVDIAKSCREVGINTVAVTAGFITDEARPEFYSVMDAANVDLKGFTQDFYKSICLAQLDPVLKTLKYLKHETDVWFEITNLVIPQANDGDDELKAMCDWIVEELGVDVPIHFTAFHPDYKMMDRDSTPASTLSRARDIAISAGINYAYTGNVHDTEGGSTYCPNCKECLIERDWYNLNSFHIKDGCCEFCQFPIVGRFENIPGTWGRRRMPVRLSDTSPPA